MKFTAKYFGLTEEEDQKKFFRIFKIQNEQQGNGIKVVNTLEVFATLIIFAKFGEPEYENLQLNIDLIEHKINLMILLFTFRDQNSLNISEIIIMAKTAMNALSRVFPSIPLFKSSQVQDELKERLIEMFKQKIEDQIKLDK